MANTIDQVTLPEWVRLVAGREAGTLIGRILGRITFINGPAADMEVGDLVRVDQIKENPKKTVFFGDVEYSDKAGSYVILKGIPADAQREDLDAAWEAVEAAAVVERTREAEIFKRECEERQAAYLAKQAEEHAVLARQIGEGAAAWVESYRTFDHYHSFSDDGRVMRAGAAHEKALNEGWVALGEAGRAAVKGFYGMEVGNTWHTLVTKEVREAAEARRAAEEAKREEERIKQSEALKAKMAKVPSDRARFMAGVRVVRIGGVA